LSFDSSDTTTPGEIQGFGNIQTDFVTGGALGPDEFLLASLPFTLDTAPLDAVDDDATSDSTLAISEDVSSVTVNVLSNDTHSGSTEWQGAAASHPNSAVNLDVVLYNDPDHPVPSENIIYGSDSLMIHSSGSLTISDLDTSETQGTVTDHGDGTFSYPTDSLSLLAPARKRRIISPTPSVTSKVLVTPPR